MNRALQGKSVIGLLPTGSGKSLTYNFSDNELKKLKSIINSNKLASKKYRIVYE